MAMALDAAFLRRTEVQSLLKALRDGQVKIMEPTLSYDYGILYEALSEIMGVTAEELNQLLEELNKLGILESHVHGNMAVCPTCGSHKFMLQLRCPTCKSPSLLKDVMIEHMNCGHIDLEENFRKGDKLVCPKCGKALKAIGVDYRKPGTLYKCLSCDGFSPTPQKHYTCSNGHSSEELELVIKNVKFYKFNPAKRTLIEREILDFSPLLEKLRESGWRVEVPAKVKGESNVIHEFVFVIWTNGQESKGKWPDIVADLYTGEKEIESIAPLAFQAKSMDAHSKEKILMVMPGLDEKAKLLAESFGINVAEASRAEEIKGRIKEILEDMKRKKRKEISKIEKDVKVAGGTISHA